MSDTIMEIDKVTQEGNTEERLKVSASITLQTLQLGSWTEDRQKVSYFLFSNLGIIFLS